MLKEEVTGLLVAVGVPRLRLRVGLLDFVDGDSVVLVLLEVEVEVERVRVRVRLRVGFVLVLETFELPLVLVGRGLLEGLDLEGDAGVIE